MVVLFILSLISLLTLVVLSLFRNESRRRFVAKLVTSLLFIIMAIAIVIENNFPFENEYCWGIIVALCIAFLGDFALGQYHIANHKLIVKSKTFWQGLGFIFFSLAQIFFIINFMTLYKFHVAFLLIPFVLITGAIAIIANLKVFDKKMTLLAITYSTLLSFMVASTVNAAYVLNFNSLGIVLLIAGVSFAISDFTLIFKYYYHKARIFTTVTSTVTYYVAQFLFAYSIYFYIFG